METSPFAAEMNRQTSAFWDRWLREREEILTKAKVAAEKAAAEAEKAATEKIVTAPGGMPVVLRKKGLTHAERVRLAKLGTLTTIRQVRPSAEFRSPVEWARGPAEVVPENVSWNWFLEHEGEHFVLKFMPDIRTQAGESVDAEVARIAESCGKKCAALLFQTRDGFFTTPGTTGRELRDAENRLKIEQEFEQTYKAELEKMNALYKQQCGSADDESADTTEGTITRLKRQIERCRARQDVARQDVAKLRPEAKADLEKLITSTRGQFVAQHEAKEKELHRKLAEAIGPLILEYHAVACEIRSAVFEHPLNPDGVPLRKLLSVDAE